MSFLVNILEGAVLFGGGAAICFLLLWWRERNLQKARTLQTDALLEKARNEAESNKRDATAAANQEALKLRQQIEQSFADRRAERAESERRLGEREALINSQLQRMMEAEKRLKHDKDVVETQIAAVEAIKRLPGAQIRLLNQVFRVVIIPGEPSRQIVRRIQMR